MSQFSILGLIFGLLANGPNDLLDYIPSDAYWAQKGMVVSVETMTRELQPPEQGGLQRATPETPKGAAVRRLMAIRALGESKDPKALEVLKPLLASKEMFEADYAAAAIAALPTNEGGWQLPYQRPQPDAKTRAADLNLLPDHLGLVAQGIQLRPGGQRPTVEQAIETLISVEQGGNAITRDELITGAIMVAERVGNLRVDSLTVGLSEDLGIDSGFVVLIFRGQYDPKMSRASFLEFVQRQTQGADPEFQAKGTEIEGIPGIKLPGLLGNMLFPDAQRLAVVFGLHATPPEAVTAVATALKTGAATIAQDEGMTKLLKQVDTTKPIWAVTRMNDHYRQVPLLAAFDSITATAQAQGPDVQIKVTATGADAAKVKAGVANINRFLGPLAAELNGNLAHDAAKAPGIQQIFDNTLATLKSVKVTTAGAQATGSATIKDAHQTLLLVPSAVYYIGNGYRAGMAPAAGRAAE